MSNQPWYQKGVQFECTGCGDCCRREGDVFFSPIEAERAVRFLHGDDATVEAFLGDIWDEDPSGYLRIQVPVGGSCAFLQPDNRCAIQPVKPDQCATYPFWPETFETERAWKAEAKWCEGIHRGPTFDVLEVARRLNEAS